MAPTTAQKPAQVEHAPGLTPELLGFKGRAPAFKPVKGAETADILDPTGKDTQTTVTRGVRVNGGADAPECLVHKDGSREVGIPLAVVTYAILGGVITDTELAALVAARARRKAQAV